MPTKQAGRRERNRASDEAVKKATGKTWTQWFATLDKAGAKKLKHQQIVAIVAGQKGAGPWWQQMITVAYEQERGLRKVHQTARGYSISKNRTLAASPTRVFKAWRDTSQRKRWLRDHHLTIRKATPGKSLRITWCDGTTNLDVMLYPRSNNRCAISVQHDKLADAKQAASMKAYWARQLDRLVEFIGGS